MTIDRFWKRMRPHFIIIGGVKCASTSMFRYLIDHPSILPGAYKEPMFFNHLGLVKATLTFPKYLKNFPLKENKQSVTLNWAKLSPEGRVIDTVIEQEVEDGIQYVTGEASATYNHAADPRVVKALLPNVKIIFLVRNPTERFISHFNMFQRFHREGRPGYDIGDMPVFVEQEIDNYHSNKPTRLLHQGLYHELATKWKRRFGENQFLITHKDQLDAPENALKLLEEVTAFLGLPAHDYANIISQKYNVAPQKETDDHSRGLLDEFYAPSNELFRKEFGISI